MEQEPSILNNIMTWLNENPIVAIISSLGAIASILSLINKKSICKWVCKLLNRRAKQTPSTSGLPHELQQQYLLGKIYIQPDITDTPPSVGNGTREPLHDFFLNKALIRNSAEPNTVYILFGDTGTGKTAALVHLYEEYNQRYAKTQPPFPNIEFIPLRESEAIDKIKQLPNPEETILLLDALDESPRVQDKTQRDLLIEELQPLLRSFARVVITCRPQLLEDSTAQVRLTHTAIRTATRFFEWTERYIAPFSNRQVQNYLDQVFTFRSENKLRKRAEKIVSEHADIAIRPLILTFIRDIVESNRKTDTTLDIYDIIIEKTLERDIKILYPVPFPKPLPELKQRWWDICSKVAASMYQHNHHNSIADKELDTIPSVAAEPQLKQRILLTRAGNEDDYHFSHKSFYEYFMAYRFFLHFKEIGNLYSMDFALQIYGDLFSAWKEKRRLRFADIQNLNTYQVAASLGTIGNSLQDLHHFSESENKYLTALTIFKLLDKKSPNKYIDDVASTLNNLANLHSNTNRYDDAEKEYQEALDIRRQLAKKNPDTYLRNVADTLNNLAILHSDTNRHDEAEKEFQEALDIRRQLAQKNPDAFLPNVATTLNNLAILHRVTNRYDDAEKEFQEALDIRRQLAKKNPDTYLPDVATTLNNLAVLHSITNRYYDAEREYQEALDIRRQLAEKNPDAFLPNVATTLNNLAILHRYTNRYDEAEKGYQEALDIYRQLSYKSPDAFLPYVAMTLFNIALFHLDQENYEAAEKAAQGSLEKYQIMAAKSPAAFDKNVEKCNNLIAAFHEGKEKLDAPQPEQE